MTTIGSDFPYHRVVARRMFFTTCAAGAFTGTDFCLVFYEELAPSHAIREPLPGTPSLPSSGGGRVGSVLVTMDRR